MADIIYIEVKGADRIAKGLKEFGDEIRNIMKYAGNDVANVVLDTEGLRKYPSLTDANRPPVPYYIRGKGTQYKRRNSGKSENYGKRWHVQSSYGNVKIGNSASYAPYLADEDLQAKHMASIGWRKLIDVVKEKKVEIVKVLQNWNDYIIRKLGL